MNVSTEEKIKKMTLEKRLNNYILTWTLVNWTVLDLNLLFVPCLFFVLTNVLDKVIKYYSRKYLVTDWMALCAVVYLAAKPLNWSEAVSEYFIVQS